MNLQLKDRLRRLPAEFLQVARRYPVETALIVLACIGCLLAYRMDDFLFVYQLPLLPLFGLIALATNLFVGQGPWRKIYWICWVPLAVYPELQVWVESWRYAVTLGVLAPLAVLLACRALRNELFISNLLVLLRSGVLAGLFANIAFGLFCAILYSTTYIFGLEGIWIEHLMVSVMIFTETFAVPLLLLGMYDHWNGSECRGSRIAEIVLNYIVTPALLVYTAILYLYMGKILVVWALPRGGVAYLVFGFMLLAIGVQALQFLLEKRRYDWFFGRFSLLSIPVLVLFWAGVIHRTGEYGLTEPRVWLLVCGGLMSLCMLLFLWKRTGHYLYVCLAAFVCFGAMTFIPALAPERIALRNQNRRVVQTARELGLLSGDGKLRLDLVMKADTTQRDALRRLYESLQYVDHRDSAAFAAFGMSDIDDFENSTPVGLRNYVLYGRGESEETNETEAIYVNCSETRRTDDIGRYRMLYTNINDWDDDALPRCRFADDTLRIAFDKGHSEFVISASELLNAQLKRIGAEGTRPDADKLHASSGELLTFETDSLMILFSAMKFDRTDSTLLLGRADVEALLIR